MKVAIVYNTAWYIYNFRRNLIQHLQKNGVEVHAICPHDSYVPKLESLGVVCHGWKLEPHAVNPVKEFVALVSLYSILKRLAPEAVLSFTIKCNIYTGLIRLLLPFRMVANISGLGRVFDQRGLVVKSVCWLYRLALRKTEKVFLQNKEDYSTFVNLGLVSPLNAALLPGSGVDVSSFIPQSKPPASGEPRKFLMLGRLVVKKGFDDYLTAARALKEKNIPCECLILGKAEDTEDSQELLERIKKAESEGIVKYLGHTDGVMSFLQKVDVVVLPSMYNEGVPRSLLEALACGKPIVTSDWKGCRETVIPGENGLLVPAGDATALSEAMGRLATADDQALRQMGVVSRRLAESKFDERYVIERYDEAIGMALPA